eukprot:1720889-Amphidinium_carterae.2
METEFHFKGCQAAQRQEILAKVYLPVCYQARGILLARPSSLFHRLGLFELGLQRQQQSASTIAPVAKSSVLIGTNSYQTSKHRKESKRAEYEPTQLCILMVRPGWKPNLFTKV